ncbi:MAG: hypothetical protein KAQ75_14000 [Bacteroidales bacterium]|nr:hypothetical protein [Bacteroidales bacterium]
METIEQIRKLKGLADFTSAFHLNCPNYPNQKILSDIDILKLNFSRYTNRTMYYAENFNNKLIEIKRQLENREDLKGQDEIMTVIPDDIFFDFDAFVLSCKSLVEGKIIERSKKFHPKVKDKFFKFAKKTFESFVKNYLAPLRNEVVHINNFGSASGSVAWIKDNKISIKAFDFSEEVELQKVFDTILKEMSKIITEIATTIMYHECYLYGFPAKEITFNLQGFKYKASEYVKTPNR